MTTDKTIKSKNQPKQTNVTWIDLSGEIPIEKHYINGQWIAVSGRGGTKKYSDLEEKPTINGVELDGNKTSQDLGVYSKPSGGIPQSDLSSSVQSQLNKHFKGWYASSSALPANPVVGDYAYVKGVTSTDPAAIYECTTAGTWSDSGRTADTSNVQTFASSQEVNEVHIVNDLTTGGTEDVLSAEQGKALDMRLGNEDVSKTFTSDDYVNLLWDGTKVVSISSAVNNNAAVVVIRKNFTYNISGTILSAVLFQSYPQANDSTYLEYWGQTVSNKKSNYDGYLLVSFKKTNTITFTTKQYGLVKEVSEIGEVVSLINRESTTFSTTANARLSKFIPISSGSYTVRLVQSHGSLVNYNLYVSDNASGTNATLIKQSAAFDDFYDVVVPDGYGYLWLFNSDLNAPAGDYLLTVYNYNAYSSLIDRHLVADLYGKKIICLGDSITAIANSTQSYGKQYSDFLSLFSGANAFSGGIGGTRITPRTDVAGSPQDVLEAWALLDMENLVNAWVNNSWDNVDTASQMVIVSGSSGPNQEKDINNLKVNPIGAVDVVTIMGGTNDYTGDVQIADIKESLGNIINAVCSANKKVKLYIVTPTVRYVGASSVELRTDDRWCDNWQNVNGDTLEDIANALIDVAKKHHIPCIDLYHNIGWNQSNFSQYFGDNDSTHPIKGLDVIGEKLFKFMRSC